MMPVFLHQCAARIFMVLAGAAWLAGNACAQSNVVVRVMAANLTTGNNFTYDTPGINIFKGLHPDIVAIQEFRYNGSPDTNGLRTLVNTAFSTNFYFFCEPGYSGSGDKPNGIISRWPIVSAGTWDDTQVNDRGFAWAQIDLPGTNDLYVVSVHLHSTGGSSSRATEATNLKALIQANFPAGAWIIVGGDFNTDNRTESCMNTFKAFLSDFPIPVDDNADPDTNFNRDKPYDYLLPSFSVTNRLIPVAINSLSYPSGLVFDSRIYSAGSLATNFPPVASGDSDASGMQHMAVVKDFLIPADGAPSTNPPSILVQPQGLTNAVGANISFAVTASGGNPLAYQWRFNGTNIAGATNNPFTLTNAQITNNGNYSVVVTNFSGSVTSSIAVLFVTNAPPAITSPPQGQSVLAGQDATFSVSATGTPPLAYQWLVGGAIIPGATTNPFILSSVLQANAGNYSVVVSNFAGSVTSPPALLSVILTNPAVFARWDFNSFPADASTATGSAAPSIGTGSASLVGGATATFATGDTAFDPAGTNDNSGWNTTTYPAQGTGNKTRGVQFAVSTSGKQNITIIWSSQSSSTGSKYGRLQYATNGTDFVDFPAAFVNGTSFTVKTNSLAAVSGVNNNPNFAFRFVSEFESTAIGTANTNYAYNGSSYATTGTMRYDMVSVAGASLVTGAPAALTPLSFTNGMFSLGVTGTVTAGYIVQTSTNLGSTNWLPVFTNASPFSFVESNLVAPQKFYRAVAQ